MNQIGWFLAYLWRDLRKDIPGQPRADLGVSPADRKKYALWVSCFTGGLAVIGLATWWPIGAVMGLVCARKIWVYATVTV